MKANKLISVILCIAMVLSTMSFTAFADGTSEPAPAKEIANVDDLRAFAEEVNAGDNYEGKTVVLANDIDLTDVAWTPISSFSGTFDGQHYTISNLTNAACLFNTITAGGVVNNLKLDEVNANLASNVGYGFIALNMAGKANNCHISNVTVNREGYSNAKGGAMFKSVTGDAIIDGCTATNITVIHAANSANTDCVDGLGGVFGGASDNAIIKNCSGISVTMTFANKTKRVGGFIEGVGGKATLENCTLTDFTIGSKEGDGYLQEVGGFAATVSGTATIKDCTVKDAEFYTSRVSRQTGGFVGQATGGTFDTCAVENVTMDLTTRGSNTIGSTAGFCGQTNGDDAKSFKNCSVTGLDMKLTGGLETGIGGFITSTGGNGEVSITSCSVEGEIDAANNTNNQPVGGFLGNLGWGGSAKVDIASSTADVDIVATGSAGGFIGKAESTNADASLVVKESTATGTLQSTSGKADAFVGTGTTGDYSNCTSNGEMIGVAAVGEKEYYDLADAFDYAKANGGSVITLLNDLDLSDWTAVNMDATAFTLDGNNKTITGLKTALIDSVTTGGKEVVIKDLTIKGAQNEGLQSSHSGAVNAGGLINVMGYVKLTLENINVVDSTIGGDSTDYAGGLIGYVGATSESVYNIKSCSVTNTSITCKSSAGGLFGHSNGGLTTISETTVAQNIIKGEKEAKEGSLIGTLTSCAGTKIDVTETTESTGTGTLNVIGRVYTGVTYTGGSYFTNPETASATNDNTQITIADKCDVVETADGKFSVQVTDGSAKIGTTQYLTIQDAVTAAAVDSVITLVKNAEEAGIKVAADDNITIDLNGFTLTGDIYSEGVLTVKNGTINSETFTSAIESKGEGAKLKTADLNVTSQRHALRIEGGSAEILSGTYQTVGRAGQTETVHALNAGGEFATTVVIENGEFRGLKYDNNAENPDSSAAVNAQANATVTINDGSFAGGQNNTLATSKDGKIIVNGGSYDQDPTPYVAEGLKVGKVNGASFWKVINDSRKMIVNAYKTEVLAGEEVTVEIILEGEKLQSVEYVLTYDKELFTFVPDSDSQYRADAVDTEKGKLTYKKYLTNSEFDPISTIGKWTFVANDVPFTADELKGVFSLEENVAWTGGEGHYGIKYPTDVVADEVYLKFKEYSVSFEVNDVAQTENEKTVPYTEEGYTVELITAPELKDANGLITIITDEDGNPCTDPTLTKIGTYTINFKTTYAEPGYKNIDETFILTIGAPERFVEVNLTGGYFSDYTVGKKLVLVHTSEDGVSFEYDGIPMVDVSAAGYKYYNTDRKYDKVFALVVDYISNDAVLADYEAKVEAVNGYAKYKIDDEYDTNINYYSTFLSEVVDGTDVTSIYNVLNQTSFSGDANPFSVSYAENKKVYMDNMLIVLKSDVKKDKIIDGNDAQDVVSDAYPKN